MNFKRLKNDEIVEMPDLRGTSFIAGEDRVYMEGDYTVQDLKDIVAEMEKYLALKEEEFKGR